MLLGPTKTVMGRRSISALAMGPKLATFSLRCLDFSDAAIACLLARQYTTFRPRTVMPHGGFPPARE